MLPCSLYWMLSLAFLLAPAPAQLFCRPPESWSLLHSLWMSQNARHKCSGSSCCSAWLLQSPSGASGRLARLALCLGISQLWLKPPYPGFKWVLKGCASTPCFLVNKAWFGFVGVFFELYHKWCRTDWGCECWVWDSWQWTLHKCFPLSPGLML